jgi:LPS O-antigen subunit length determinant protein (WzzB/FepE family)
MAKKENNKGFVYDAFDLIRFAWEKKWILITLSVAALIASIIISLMITPRFRSRVIMFPAASISVSKNLVETSVITSDTKDILTFGEDEEAERLLQVLSSDQVREHVIKKFNLMQHYRIDTASKYPYTQLMNKYKSNVKFHRTEFLSIEIEVMDEDAQMAADIANSIATYIDSVYYNIKYERAQEAYSIVEKEYTDSKNMISSLTDSLSKIRAFGVNDYESQSEGLNKAYAEALGAGKMELVKMIQRQLDIMAKYGGIYVELSDRLEWEIERNSMLKAKMAAARVNLESTMSNVFIVDKANKSEKKAVPRRSLIVIMTTLSVFVLTLLILLIIDNIKVRY